MPLLEIPPPYDFELSTERYRAFGPDLANLWHDGGFHRVIAGREVRITAADEAIRALVRALHRHDEPPKTTYHIYAKEIANPTPPSPPRK